MVGSVSGGGSASEARPAGQRFKSGAPPGRAAGTTPPGRLELGRLVRTAPPGTAGLERAPAGGAYAGPGDAPSHASSLLVLALSAPRRLLLSPLLPKAAPRPLGLSRSEDSSLPSGPSTLAVRAFILINNSFEMTPCVIHYVLRESGRPEC